MTDHVSMHAVVMFIGGGVATVGVAFVLYWKLLAQRHCQRKVSAKRGAVVSRRREISAPAAVTGKECALQHACK